jgi:hypothetical protein
MKALKTIVATAVIVFALTTVAMAGVQRLGGTDGATTQATPAAAQAAVHPVSPASMTLSAQQFAALLHAVSRNGARTADADGAGAHTQKHRQTHARQQSRTHSLNGDASRSGSSTAHDATTHHGATHHTDTGTHDGGTHDGGCD